MSTMQPIAFLSYVHADDENDSGYLTELRKRLSAEVRAQTGTSFPIFQDRDGIEWGQNWKERINGSLDNVTFLIPIITPSYFRSNSCRNELARFRDRERKLGRNDLVLPIYYIDSQLDDKHFLSKDDLAELIATHQYIDWRDLRGKSFKNTGVIAKLRQMADQIRKALERVNTAEIKSIDYSEENIVDYLKFLSTQCARLDPRGLLRGPKTHDVILPLEEVFVTLKAGPNNPWEREAEQNLLDSDVEDQLKRLGLTMLDTTQLETLTQDFRYANLAREAHMLIEKRLQGGEISNFERVFQTYRWIAILGDPGSGKTTLLHWLALQFARAFIAKEERVIVSGNTLGHDENISKIDLGPVRFPILIRIADYSKARRASPSLSLIDYIGHQPILGQYAEIPQEKLASISKDQLSNGRAIVLLDGLDEITDSADRRLIRDQIERFVEGYVKDPESEHAFASQLFFAESTVSETPKWWATPKSSTPIDAGGNQIVITSRIAGYRNAVLRGEIRHYLIEPLDDKTIERFCRRWTLAVERYLARQSGIADEDVAERANLEADALIEEIFHTKGVRKLATNPLLLTILALLHREQSHLPSHRIELYRQAVQTLIERRETALTEPQVVDILGPFALWLLENEPTGLATEGELKERISTGMRRWLGVEETQELPGKFILEIQNFIDSAREQTGLLVARGEGLYCFMHLTFLEYFVARELTRQPSTAKEKLLHYLHSPRWREALLLAIANISAVQRGDLSDVMASILESKSENEDILHRNLLFAASCVADTVWMPPEILRRITSELVVLYSDKNGNGRFKALRKQLIDAFEDIYRQDTAGIVESVFTKILKGNASNLREAAGEILAQVSWGSSELLTTLVNVLKESGEPDPILRAINRLLDSNISPSKDVQQFAFTTLQHLYSTNLQVKSSIDLLKEKTPDKFHFIEIYGTQVNPVITPILVDLLMKRNALSEENFTSGFWIRLRLIFEAMATTGLGFEYVSAMIAIANLDGSAKFALRSIRNNITNGINRKENIDLYIMTFSATENIFESQWWNTLLVEDKKLFLEIALERKKGGVLEEQAWVALGEREKELGITALKLLSSLHSITLSCDRLKLLETYLSIQEDEIIQIAGDVIERASPPDNIDDLSLANRELEAWLESENETLRSFGAILLASQEILSARTYQTITETLRSSNDRFRQFANRVMHKPRRASLLSFDVINQANEANWYEGEKRLDGLATLAHQTFIRGIVHDVPDYIRDWSERLSHNITEQERDIIQCGLGNVELCEPLVFQEILNLIGHTYSKDALESLLVSLAWIARHKTYDESPEKVILILSNLVLSSPDSEIRILAAKTIGYFDFHGSYTTLERLSQSPNVETAIAGIEGLRNMSLYGAKWRKQISENVFRYLQTGVEISDITLREVAAKTWAQTLLLSNLKPEEILQKITENLTVDILRICLEIGDGDDDWDEVACDDDIKFHSKLLNTIRLMVINRPSLLDELAKQVLEKLKLPKTEWTKKRVSLGALSVCVQDTPANFAQLPMVDELEQRLLDAAMDPGSFNVRRFALISLGQLRRVNNRILDVLTSGCRDLGVVQRSVFQSISSLRWIETDAVSQLVQLLYSPSTATQYAAAMIIKEIGSSTQAVKQFGLRESIANGLSQRIREIKFSRYVFIEDQFIGKLDDILFAVLVQVTADNPLEAISDEIIAESRLALAGLREISGNPTANLVGLERIRSQAQEMQKELQAESITVEGSGIQLIISADQKIQHLEYKGQKNAMLSSLLNKAIKESQQIAAKLLGEMSSSLKSLLGGKQPLDEVRKQALDMQARLQEEHIKLDEDNIIIVLRGDQLFESIYINGENAIELTEVLNEAIKKSQQIAAGKLRELSSSSKNNNDLFEIA